MFSGGGLTVLLILVLAFFFPPALTIVNQVLRGVAAILGGLLKKKQCYKIYFF